ncbi:MAG TPA: hypothetical protein VHQ47_17670 [Phycisphaerae bacterium]|nr:hypothetical protein [Phycisphaerae bacterium]
MASELKIAAPSGLAIYAIIVSMAGTFAAGTSLEAYDAAHWTDYAVALTEIGAGIYAGDFPALAADSYGILYFRRAGATPAVSDAPAIGAENILWDGAAIGIPATADDVPTAAEIDAELTDAHGTGEWGGSGGAGDGNIPVNHNTGGTDALRVVAGGVGIEGCTIRAYIKADYDAGLRVVKAEAATGDDGRWIEDMMLSAGTYTLTFSAPGYVLADQEVTIVS